LIGGRNSIRDEKKVDSRREASKARRQEIVVEVKQRKMPNSILG